MSEKHYNIKNKLNVKDLITTGIFSAMLWIAMMLGGALLAINPITTFYTPIGSALLGGPIFLLLVAKVHKRGSITIVGVIMGIMFFLTGMHWGMYLGYVLCGIIADFIAGSKKYNNIIMNSIAYTVLSFGGLGAFIVYFLDPLAWSAVMLNGGTSKNYIEAMNSVATPSTLIVMFVSTTFISLLSAWGGNILLKKQFEKAGITA